jgi:hypothetical protein
MRIHILVRSCGGRLSVCVHDRCDGVISREWKR